MAAKYSMRFFLAILLVLVAGACVLGAPLEEAHAASATATTVKVGAKTYKMKLESGAPAQAFRAYLSKARTLKMSELNGNEKYRYLSGESFPTAEKRYRKVKAGDVMLYGDDCLVIFYKAHKTSYSYTKIGRLTSTKGLAKAVGKKSVKVRFAKMKQAKAKGEGSQTAKAAAPAAQPVSSQPDAADAALPDSGSVNGSSAGLEVPANPGTGGTVPEESASTERLALSIGNRDVTVTFAENDAVRALAVMAAASPVVVEAHAYGGFEQVGPLPASLPASDTRITTKPGDIVLYQGNQVCVFHGSNTWSYTPLGHIEGLTDAELKALLDSEIATLVFSMVA